MVWGAQILKREGELVVTLEACAKLPADSQATEYSSHVGWSQVW